MGIVPKDAELKGVVARQRQRAKKKAGRPSWTKPLKLE
jgi:hypothetical protein